MIIINDAQSYDLNVYNWGVELYQNGSKLACVEFDDSCEAGYVDYYDDDGKLENLVLSGNSDLYYEYSECTEGGKLDGTDEQRIKLEYLGQWLAATYPV